MSELSNASVHEPLSPQMIQRRWIEKGAGAGLPAPSSHAWWELAPEARDLALSLHQGQARAGGAEPYAWHLAEAAMIVGLFHVLGAVSDEELPLLLSIVWLHDSVEDQGANPHELGARFGQQAGQAIDALTKRDKSERNPDPMGDSLARIGAAGKLAALAKVADRLSNLAGKAPHNWSASKIERYGQEGLRIRDALSPWIPPSIARALELAVERYGAHAPKPAPKRAM